MVERLEGNWFKLVIRLYKRLVEAGLRLARNTIQTPK